MQILLVRHGQTTGNKERRYVGRTDETLTEDAADALLDSPYRKYRPDRVYVSPMLRCRQTADILFGQDEEPQTGITGCGMDARRILCDDLRETDFGEFEYKNYEELKDDPRYQAWIDGGGIGAFPGGEDGIAFRERCANAFAACVLDALRNGASKIAFVVHGGTIMSILERYGIPEGEFYRWQVKNGEGFLTEWPEQESPKIRLEIIK